jgi:hypothetical protein
MNGRIARLLRYVAMHLVRDYSGMYPCIWCETTQVCSHASGARLLRYVPMHLVRDYSGMLPCIWSATYTWTHGFAFVRSLERCTPLCHCQAFSIYLIYYTGNLCSGHIEVEDINSLLGDCNAATQSMASLRPAIVRRY